MISMVDIDFELDSSAAVPAAEARRFLLLNALKLEARHGDILRYIIYIYHVANASEEMIRLYL
jgi:hypothetical protein